jgi:hypothetical protein
LTLSYDQRVAVVLSGLGFDNSSRVLWEAAAAIPFTAFCAAAMIGPPHTAQKAWRGSGGRCRRRSCSTSSC